MVGKIIISILIILPTTLLSGDLTVQYRLFDRDPLAYLHNESFHKRKSPLLAAGMSLAVPGVGEMYSGEYIRGAVHMGIEVAGWIFYLTYQNRGNKQTARFEQFADTHWSVVKYAEWLNTYWADDAGLIIPIDEDESKNPWERVHWPTLNEFESQIPEFTHRLEPFGTQQYYELIGKYPQYNRGWADSNPFPDPGMEKVLYYDDISDKFSNYSSMRGYANVLYARSHNALIALFLNHVISAFHAKFLARRFNEVHFSVDLNSRYSPSGEQTVAFFRLTVRF